MSSAAQVSLAYEISVLEELKRARAREGLLNFICYTKADFYPYWHNRVIARELNKVMRGETKRLVVTMPPRHGKTEGVSVRLPCLWLGRNPNAQVICATYNADYAKKVNRDVQRVMDSEEYKELFPDSRMNSKNIRTVAGAPIRNSDMFELVPPAKGFYKSTSIGGPLTGFGADLLICDDYCKNYDVAKSETYRESVWNWWTTTFTTRALPGCAIIICATRWHEDDLIGRVLAQSTVKGALPWTVLNLPAVAEQSHHPEDPRAVGQALWPERYDEAFLSAKRAEGERSFISMYQQRPAPQEGNIVRTTWWRYWRELPDQIDLLCASADLAYNNQTGKEDFTVITIWARSGVDFYLVEMIRDRMGWLEQKRAFERLCKDYPDLNAIYVEDAALGAAIIAELREVVAGVVAVKPRGGKATRLEAVSGLIQGGNVLLPDAEHTGNHCAELLVAEASVFPNGAHDDIVDSMSQALSQMRLHDTGGDWAFDGLHLEKESSIAGLRGGRSLIR